jgi:DNA-directed RNA polymerase specialized sigma subunit
LLEGHKSFSPVIIIMEEVMSPIDAYLSSKEKNAAVREEEDINAFQTWQKNPSKDNLSSLYKRFNSEFDKRVNLWSGGAKKINPVVIKMDLKKNALKAFQTYDPTKGATLRTHVNNTLRRSQRTVGLYQNMAYIPEEKRFLISPINTARDALFDEKGSDPSHQDIADYLNKNPKMIAGRIQGRVTPKLIQNVAKYQIKDIPDMGFEDDPSRITSSSDVQVSKMLPMALEPRERDFYDYYMGLNGKPKINKISDIGRRLGLSPTQASRMHRKIINKFKKYT